MNAVTTNEKGTLQSKQVGASRPDPFLGESFHASAICQHQVAVPQLTTVRMPEQVPIRRQPNKWHRGRPETASYRRVREIEHDKVRLPAGREMLANSLPIVSPGNRQIDISAAIKCQAF